MIIKPRHNCCCDILTKQRKFCAQNLQLAQVHHCITLQFTCGSRKAFLPTISSRLWIAFLVSHFTIWWRCIQTQWISIFNVISIFWHQWIGGREGHQYEQEKKWKEVALRVVVPKHLLKISGTLLFRNHCDWTISTSWAVQRASALQGRLNGELCYFKTKIYNHCRR